MRNRGFSLHLVLIVGRVGAPSETGSRLSTHTHGSQCYRHALRSRQTRASGQWSVAVARNGLVGGVSSARSQIARVAADYWRRLWAVPIGQATHANDCIVQTQTNKKPKCFSFDLSHRKHPMHIAMTKGFYVCSFKPLSSALRYARLVRIENRLNSFVNVLFVCERVL